MATPISGSAPRTTSETAQSPSANMSERPTTSVKLSCSSWPSFSPLNAWEDRTRGTSGTQLGYIPPSLYVGKCLHSSTHRILGPSHRISLRLGYTSPG